MRSVVVLCLLSACFTFDGGGQTPPPPDSPVGNDAAPSDVPADIAIDAPLGCAADFVTITGGQTGHRYKFLSIENNWANQHNPRCATDGAYLAIANDLSELAALRAMIGGNELWIGASDRVAEGDFVDVFNNVYATNCGTTCMGPGGINIGNNKSVDDCLFTVSDTTIEVVACSELHVAVCECEEM